MLEPTSKGFTLIELLVTVVIVSILASIAFPLVGMNHVRIKEQELHAALREIRTAIDSYKQATDEGRIFRTLEQSGYPPNLSVLVDGVEDARSPIHKKIYFLRRIPRDPFADESMKAEATWGLRSYESSAERPMAGKDVFDVYSLSSQIGLNGVPYKEW